MTAEPVERILQTLKTATEFGEITAGITSHETTTQGRDYFLPFAAYSLHVHYDPSQSPAFRSAQIWNSGNRNIVVGRQTLNSFPDLRAIKTKAITAITNSAVYKQVQQQYAQLHRAPRHHDIATAERILSKKLDENNTLFRRDTTDPKGYIRLRDGEPTFGIIYPAEPAKHLAERVHAAAIKFSDSEQQHMPDIKFVLKNTVPHKWTKANIGYEYASGYQENENFMYYDFDYSQMSDYYNSHSNDLISNGLISNDLISNGLISNRVGIDLDMLLISSISLILVALISFCLFFIGIIIGYVIGSMVAKKDNKFEREVIALDEQLV